MMCIAVQVIQESSDLRNKKKEVHSRIYFSEVIHFKSGVGIVFEENISD